MAVPPSPRSHDPKRATRRRQIVYGLLVAFTVIVVIDALVGDQGLIARRNARREKADLQARVDRTKAGNAAMTEEIRRLDSADPATIEEIARRELGLIRPGERIFILKDLDPPSPR